MSTESPTHRPKSPVSDARFWYCVVEATDAKGKLDYERLAEITGYKNWNSARVAFFTKRKQMRIFDAVKGGGTVKKEMEKVDAGVKKRGKKKETKEVKKEKDENGYEVIKKEEEEEG